MEEVRLTDVKVGEIIQNNDLKMVVLKIRNYEDMGSCAYDRIYTLCTLDELEEVSTLTNKEFRELGYDVKLTGTSVPMVLKYDEAPFEIEETKAYRIRRKQEKLIKVYK